MGKIKQGILGGFRGKVGSVVGQRINGAWIMKAYQGEVKNPKTVGQEYYRSIFAKTSSIMKSACPADWSFLKTAKIGVGSNARTEAFRYVYAFKRFEVTEGVVWQYEPRVERMGIVPTVPFTINFAGAGQSGIVLGTPAQAGTPGEYFFGFDFAGVSENLVADFLSAEDIHLKIWYINTNGQWAYWQDFLLTPEVVNDSIPLNQLPNCGAFGTPDEINARIATRVTNMGEFYPLGESHINANQYPRQLLWSIEGITESGLPRVFGVGVKDTDIRISQ